MEQQWDLRYHLQWQTWWWKNKQASHARSPSTHLPTSGNGTRWYLPAPPFHGIYTCLLSTTTNSINPHIQWEPDKWHTWRDIVEWLITGSITPTTLLHCITMWSKLGGGNSTLLMGTVHFLHSSCTQYMSYDELDTFPFTQEKPHNIYPEVFLHSSCTQYNYATWPGTFLVCRKYHISSNVLYTVHATTGMYFLYAGNIAFPEEFLHTCYTIWLGIDFLYAGNIYAELMEPETGIEVESQSAHLVTRVLDSWSTAWCSAYSQAMHEKLSYSILITAAMSK